LKNSMRTLMMIKMKEILIQNKDLKQDQ